MTDEKDKEIKQLKNSSKVSSFLFWLFWNVLAVVSVFFLNTFAVVGGNQVLITSPPNDLATAAVEIIVSLSTLVLWVYIILSSSRWFVEIFSEEITSALDFLSKIKIIKEEKHD